MDNFLEEFKKLKEKVEELEKRTITDLSVDNLKTDLIKLKEQSSSLPQPPSGIGFFYYKNKTLYLKNEQNETTIIVPVGTILPFASSIIPSGFLLCDGSEVSRTTYSELFNVIGTTYGSGNGSTTFNLPNLKGRVLVGLDSSQSEFNNLGKTGGSKTHTLSISEIPSHNHSLTGVNNNNFTVQAGMGAGVSGIPNNVSGWGSYNQAHWFTGSFTTVYVGGGQPHNNLQPYLTINFIIKY